MFSLVFVPFKNVYECRVAVGAIVGIRDRLTVIRSAEQSLDPVRNKGSVSFLSPPITP